MLILRESDAAFGFDGRQTQRPVGAGAGKHHSDGLASVLGQSGRKRRSPGRAGSHPIGCVTRLPSSIARVVLETQLANIFRWVKRSTGVDFSQYEPSTLRRRILRRMVLNKMETVGSYLTLLEGDPAEVEALYRDLLINVTSFFRDPETFEYFRTSSSRIS